MNRLLLGPALLLSLWPALALGALFVSRDHPPQPHPKVRIAGPALSESFAPPAADPACQALAVLFASSARVNHSVVAGRTGLVPATRRLEARTARWLRRNAGAERPLRDLGRALRSQLGAMENAAAGTPPADYNEMVRAVNTARIRLVGSC